MLSKGLGNLPWWSFLKMSLVLMPYGIFGSSASEKFPSYNNIITQKINGKVISILRYTSYDPYLVF
jgi:hypothetical protein